MRAVAQRLLFRGWALQGFLAGQQADAPPKEYLRCDQSSLLSPWQALPGCALDNSTTLNAGSTNSQ
jgi:hypothetical protein